MSQQLKDWVRLDAKNVPVIGSNIRRTKKPKSGRWMLIEKHIDCCGPELSAEPEDTDLDGYIFTLMCDNSDILTLTFTDEDVANMGELVSSLNKKLEFLGVFSTDGTNVIFQVKKVVKDSLCPDDALTFTIEAIP